MADFQDAISSNHHAVHRTQPILHEVELGGGRVLLLLDDRRAMHETYCVRACCTGEGFLQFREFGY